MTTTTIAAPVAPVAPVVPFPLAAVEARLRAELIEAVEIEAGIRGIALPSDLAEIAKAAVDVDSLVVVSILCAVEPIVGFELPESVVRTGGYTSAESALEHLLPQIERQWMKQKGKRP